MEDDVPADAIASRIRRLARRDGRYAFAAFAFVSDAVQAASEWLRDGTLAKNDPRGGSRGRGEGGKEEFHVSGQELLAAFERLAKKRWGLLADRVLASWGLRRPADVGEVVFLLVEAPDIPWKKRPCDTRDDFAAEGDFTERLAWWSDEDD